MSYEKQTWKTGDIITSEGLNHIEDGIANNQIVIIDATVNIKEIDGNIAKIVTLTKTFQEIQNLINNNIFCFIKTILPKEESQDYILSLSYIKGIKKDLENNNGCQLYTADFTFFAETVNDYPSNTNGGIK